MKNIICSLAAFLGMWAFLVFFSSQLPQALPKKPEMIALNLKEIKALEEKLKEKPKELPQVAAGVTQAQFAAEGQAYLRSGGSAAAGELPRIIGDADEQTYLEFTRVSGAKLLVYSPGLKQYLGELKASGPSPALVPLDVVRFKANFPSEGRMVKDAGLLALAAAAARQEGKRGAIKLYMALPSQQQQYLVGKLLATLREEGLEIKDVATVDAKYSVAGGSAKIILVSAVLKTGAKVSLKDLEA